MFIRILFLMGLGKGKGILSSFREVLNLEGKVISCRSVRWSQEGSRCAGVVTTIQEERCVSSQSMFGVVVGKLQGRQAGVVV